MLYTICASKMHCQMSMSTVDGKYCNVSSVSLGNIVLIVTPLIINVSGPFDLAF